MFAQSRKHAYPLDQPPSHVGRALKVTGILDMDGDLYVYGTVTGRINATRVILAPEASVDGDVVARDVHIEGRMNGRVFALNVRVESSATVTGRIFYNTLSVAHGARVDGRMPWRPPSYFETLTQLPEIRP
jgi:cytoskeletal protein CcmA (bactofilin family)